MSEKLQLLFMLIDFVNNVIVFIQQNQEQPFTIYGQLRAKIERGIYQGLYQVTNKFIAICDLIQILILIIIQNLNFLKMVKKITYTFYILYVLSYTCKSYIFHSPIVKLKSLSIKCTD